MDTKFDELKLKVAELIQAENYKQAMLLLTEFKSNHRNSIQTAHDREVMNHMLGFVKENLHGYDAELNPRLQDIKGLLLSDMDLNQLVNIASLLDMDDRKILIKSFYNECNFVAASQLLIHGNQDPVLATHYMIRLSEEVTNFEIQSKEKALEAYKSLRLLGSYLNNAGYGSELEWKIQQLEEVIQQELMEETQEFEISDTSIYEAEPSMQGEALA